MYTRTTSLPKLYTRNIIPDDMGIPLLEHLAISGWGYTDFHASMNFAFWDFCEVRLQDVEYRSLEIVRPFEYLSALSDA
jgi:hypothetical protein